MIFAERTGGEKALVPGASRTPPPPPAGRLRRGLSFNPPSAWKVYRVSDGVSSSPTYPDQSSCPHDPPCRISPCLPDDLHGRPPGPLFSGQAAYVRTPAQPGESAPDDKDGYEAQTDKIVIFADVMLEADANVGRLKTRAPMADYWNPVLGVPPVPGGQLRRLNGFIEEWVEAAGILQKVLGDDAPKLRDVARRYDEAHGNAEKAVDQINL
ncbi:hypothetical protein [Streptosporangium roseum]|uniref:hypothetical protein n=1 Tax=Streptosporangium roseum TaxID=2001 RepID=UPI0033224871